MLRRLRIFGQQDKLKGRPPTTGIILIEVNSGLAEPGVALTATGADIEIGRATP
jgi:hypothetical protein